LLFCASGCENVLIVSGYVGNVLPYRHLSIGCGIGEKKVCQQNGPMSDLSFKR